MKFDIITIFPNLFDSYLEQSILNRAQQEGLIEVNIHDLRDWTSDSHKTVDDKPYGGGRGMILKVGPVYKAVSDLKEETSKVVLFTPRGKKFNQKIAYSLSQLDQLIFICGRYEGVDERVKKHIADINLSIGDYVLMGGELPAMVVIEATARLIPGVIQKPEQFQERVTDQKGFVEYPQYTRPEVFETESGQKWKVPQVLLSGNHKKIKKWRQKHQKIIE